ncbi:major facilitator superfamily domain-containing protein [Mucidula mucida]|nr:major facilitator superfamily domain-containing protein [Mucidula mucida]
MRAWLVVLGGFCLSMSTFGYVVSWGTFQAYYELTLLKGVSPSAIAWIGSAQYSLIFLPGLVAGRLFDLGFFRISLISSCAAMTIFNFLTAECVHYWQFLLCQGVALGLAAGCIYIPCISVMSHWFRVRRPVAFSIVAFGSSVGGIIYPIIFKNLVASVGFKWTVRTIAFINLATFIVAGLTMRTRLPPSKSLSSLLNIRAFASPAYCTYVFSTFLSFLGVYTPLTFLAVSAAQIGVDSNFILYLVSIANGASAVGRLMSGVFALKFGALNVMIVMNFVAALMTYVWPVPSSTGGFVVVTVFYGIFSGAFISLFPVPVAQLGSTDDIGRRTGMQMTVMALGALAGPPISGAIRQAHSDYTLVGVYAGTMVLASVVCMIVTKYLVVHTILGGKF